ncbi:glycosyltransferase [uncultured Cyclobacterium sp.]|uniref:glycosyltransferase n=1 Tax=uncultured Cyclobacterium sp. TaxID=453820 RepID=UPI0030EBC369
MKIFHPLLCYYPSQAGGPANTLYWLNSEINKREFDISVLSTNFGLDPLKSLHDVSNAINSPRHQVLFLDSSRIKFLKYGFDLINESDVVQFSSLFFFPTLPLLIKATFNRKKIILSPRGELYPAALKNKSLQKRIFLFFIKIFQNKVIFHATNNFESNIINKYFPRAKEIITIPNYVKMPLKRNVKITNGQLLFIGRINPIKNIDVLIKSVVLSQKLSKVKLNLLIVGSARLPYEIAYEKRLKQLVKTLNIQDSVTFMGHVQGGYKDKLIASSQALVLPSQSENFGNVVLEALAQGTPVIASKNTPWQSLTKFNAGYWTEGSVDGISKSIVQLIDLPKIDYLKMRDRAYSLCLNNFDIKSNIFHWEKLYKKLSHVQK